MAKGMEIPVRVNGRGGARIIAASPYTRQVILNGLTPNTSRNPFQAGLGVEVGVSEAPVFKVNGPGAKAAARRDIVRFFARIRNDDIAKLASADEGLSFTQQEAELVAKIRYIELESDREGEVESNLKDAFRSAPGNVGGTV
jgi:hypothetical protein